MKLFKLFLLPYVTKRGKGKYSHIIDQNSIIIDFRDFRNFCLT